MWDAKILASVHISALFVQSVLYGVFALFFCIILSISLGPEHGRFKNGMRILQISSLMFILATIHLITTLIRIFIAFTTSRELDNIVALLGEWESPLLILKTFICLVQAMLGDGILVWRCYVLHDKVVWVLIPGTIILLLDTGILTMYRILIARGIKPQWEWSLVFLVLSVVLHMSYTGAIARKIYYSTNSQNLRTTGRNFTPVVTALIETGAAYSMTAIVLLVCTATNSLGQIVVMDAVPPLVGIIFCLLILQIHVYMKDRESNPSGISANWSIPWRRGQRDLEGTDRDAPS